jgi:predicted transcriptional regulator
MALILTKSFIASLVLNKIHQGLNDVEEGRLITTEELRREIEEW